MSKTDYSISLKGGIGVRAGVKLGVGLSPTGMAKFMYVGVSVDSGMYTEVWGFISMTGVASAYGDIKQSGLSSFIGGMRMETGVYVQLNFEWKFALWKGKTPIAKKNYPFYELDLASDIAAWKIAQEESADFGQRSFNALGDLGEGGQAHYLTDMSLIDFLTGDVRGDTLSPLDCVLNLRVISGGASSGKISISEYGIITIPDDVKDVVEMELLIVSKNHKSTLAGEYTAEPGIKISTGYQLFKTVKLRYLFFPLRLLPILFVS